MPKSSVLVRTAVKHAAPVPRGQRRRQELVALAEEVFFENGYTDATMQALAERAGASKETLYRHFRNKDGLLTEVVTNRIRRLLMPLNSALERGGAVADVLHAFGIELLQIMMHPDVVALLRTVVAETPRCPALGQMFYEVGPERTRMALVDFLRTAEERGEVRVADPRLAATIYLGAVMSYSHAAGLVLVDLPALTPSEIQDRVAAVVAMFLLQYGAA